MGQERVPDSVTCQFEPTLRLHPSPQSLDWRHLALVGYPGCCSEAWLKRLAAAYNACRGVPTEALEKLGSCISHPVADALNVLLQVDAAADKIGDRLEETCRGLAAILRPEPPIDPVEELKTKTRERLAAEQAKRDEEAAKQEELTAEAWKPVIAAIHRAWPALVGAQITRPTFFMTSSDLTEAVVSVPGHFPLHIAMMRVGGVPWQPNGHRPICALRGHRPVGWYADLGEALLVSEELTSEST